MAVRITEDELEPEISFRAVPREQWGKLLDLKASWVMRTMDQDARVLGSQTREICDTEAWRERCSSFREFVERHWRIDWEIYLSIMNGLHKIGYDDPVKRDDAERLGRMLATLGARADAETISQGARTDLEPLSNRKKLQGGGTGADYLRRRLARDHEEILDRYEAGEFESVRQAAIAAGIVKVASPDEKAVAAFRKAENRLNVLRHIVAELEQSERNVLIEWLSESEA